VKGNNINNNNNSNNNDNNVLEAVEDVVYIGTEKIEHLVSKIILSRFTVGRRIQEFSNNTEES
jgi:hypothetical protein